MLEPADIKALISEALDEILEEELLTEGGAGGHSWTA